MQTRRKPFEEGRIPNARWMEILPSFEQVWNGDVNRIDLENGFIKIYKVGKVTRMDVKSVVD